MHCFSNFVTCFCNLIFENNISIWLSFIFISVLLFIVLQLKLLNISHFSFKVFPSYIHILFQLYFQVLFLVFDYDNTTYVCTSHAFIFLKEYFFFSFIYFYFSFSKYSTSAKITQHFLLFQSFILYFISPFFQLPEFKKYLK